MVPIVLFVIGAGLVALLFRESAAAAEQEAALPPAAPPPAARKMTPLAAHTPYRVMENGVKLYQASMPYKLINKEKSFSREPLADHPGAVVHLVKQPSGKIDVLPKIIIKLPGGKPHEEKVRDTVNKYAKRFEKGQGQQAVAHARKVAQILGAVTGKYTRGGGDVLIQSFSLPRPVYGPPPPPEMTA